MLKSTDIAADQVRAARAFLGLSQTELAAAAGVTRKSVYELEHGAKSMDSTILAVRRALEARGILFVEHNDKVGVLGDKG